ncbi:hypothetical protein BdWA1_002864 [Babesia duncani]|uniref:Uncharacterized protein n=1 Tax=Babesia duncani TaxID=323732 RepID=A0AAD9UMY6_9APIC|nr:hypothetical protein BdWA1_002864 [Babesia duncani]
MLFCMHFSLQYELVSLDLDDMHYEFEPKKYFLPRLFVPRYLDVYASKDYEESYFMINLSSNTPRSDGFMHFLFKVDGNRIMNYASPNTPRGFTLYNKDSVVYYLTKDPNLIPRIAFRDYFGEIRKDIKVDASSAYPIRVSLNQVTLKLKSFWGKTILFTGSLVPSRPGSALKWCCPLFYLPDVFRYKLIKEKRSQ